MTIKEVYEKYGSAKYLTRAKKSDFSPFTPTNHYVYKDVQLRIEYDRYNSRWSYSSEDFTYSGVFYGSLKDLINSIEYDINHILASGSLYDTLLEVKSR